MMGIRDVFKNMEDSPHEKYYQKAMEHRVLLGRWCLEEGMLDDAEEMAMAVLERNTLDAKDEKLLKKARKLLSNIQKKKNKRGLWNWRTDAVILKDEV